jgi:hypothetical protein
LTLRAAPPDVSAAAKEKKSANWGVDGGAGAQMSSDRPSAAAAALVDDGDIPVRNTLLFAQPNSSNVSH